MLFSSETESPVLVVRIRTTFWHDNKGLYSRRCITYLRRKSRGHNVLDEDVSCIGANEVIEKITNLNEVKDGEYLVVTCNESRDHETGHIDDYDYRLVPVPKELPKPAVPAACDCGKIEHGRHHADCPENR